ncbi:hypothetical protein [Robertmurraya massiliosenegalensis]|uniref:hypothetical protein n=1 Tax=Robertmurraya massiliosenegalensis TaxID=1287657 RepID=UPI00030E3677|nr:hypothetical protein [Robertmurraya massiliosenegalensis]
MEDKRTETEKANIKINQILNGEKEENSFDVDPLINNNNIALVLNEQDDKKKS